MGVQGAPVGRMVGVGTTVGNIFQINDCSGGDAAANGTGGGAGADRASGVESAAQGQQLQCMLHIAPEAVVSSEVYHGHRKHLPRPKRSAALSSRHQGLSVGFAMEPSPLRDSCRGDSQTHNNDSHTPI